jgi:hypothetical protein
MSIWKLEKTKDLIINKNDSIDIRDCYKQTGIEDILGTLDKELVGLGNVKTRVKEISSVLLSQYNEQITYEKLTGFLGSSSAKEIDVIGSFANGIAPNCNDLTFP